MNHPQMDRAKCERMQQQCVCRYLVLVEVGGLSDEGGVGIAGACPEGGHPIQQGADLEFKGNIFDVNQMKHVHHVKNKKNERVGLKIHYIRRNPSRRNGGISSPQQEGPLRLRTLRRAPTHIPSRRALVDSYIEVCCVSLKGRLREFAPAESRNLEQ